MHLSVFSWCFWGPNVKSENYWSGWQKQLHKGSRKCFIPPNNGKSSCARPTLVTMLKYCVKTHTIIYFFHTQNWNSLRILVYISIRNVMFWCFCSERSHSLKALRGNDLMMWMSPVLPALVFAVVQFTSIPLFCRCWSNQRHHVTHVQMDWD